MQTPTPPVQMVTKRLVLRKPRPSDAAAKYEHGCHPDVIRFMDWMPHATLEDAARYVERASWQWESGEHYSWVITERGQDMAIGSVGCSMNGHAAELGFVIYRGYWGFGYATEAAGAILGWAATTDTVHRVWATCDAENLASARVLEKLGMQREGLLRRYAVRPNLAPGVPRDAIMYSWVRSA